MTFAVLFIPFNRQNDSSFLWAIARLLRTAHLQLWDVFFVLFLQLMSQYPSLYSPAHSESGKWDALVKASESLLKEKELIIERQVFRRFTAGSLA